MHSWWIFPTVEAREQREMKTILSFWRKHKKVIGWLIVFGILFTCGIFLLACRERIAVILSPVIFSDNPDSDDQRSAM